MKADLRISIKDYSRDKNLKVTLTRAPFASRQFFVQMTSLHFISARQDGQPWPADGRPASLTKVVTALRKALVRAAGV